MKHTTLRTIEIKKSEKNKRDKQQTWFEVTVENSMYRISADNRGNDGKKSHEEYGVKVESWGTDVRSDQV